MDIWKCCGLVLATTKSSDWKFCPYCGTSRPVDKKVALPEKIETNGVWTCDADEVIFLKINQIIDYLSTKPWEKP